MTRTYALAISALLTAAPASGQSWYHHRSTAFGDAMSGLGDLGVGVGLQNYYSAQAYRTWAQAESQLYEIRRQEEQLRWERSARRREEHQARAERRRAARIEQARFRPQRPEPALVDLRDPAGGLAWPTALEGSEFATDRTAVDGLLQRWLSSGEPLSRQERQALEDHVESLRATLADEARRLRLRDYVAARNTLRLLEQLALSEEAGESV